MLRIRRPIVELCLAATVLAAAASQSIAQDKRRPAGGPASVRVHGFPAGCAVELDALPSGKTDSAGLCVLTGVNAGDHYVHVDCPGQPAQAFFISPEAGKTAEIEPRPAKPELPPLEAAQARQKLEKLVEAATQERSEGHSEAAIEGLRSATLLDPENADLHRELGITFLLLRDWERARVEFTEAIKHDPSEAESHNSLGYALEKLGELQPAANEFRLATRLDPDEASYRAHYFEALSAIEAAKDKDKQKK